MEKIFKKNYQYYKNIIMVKVIKVCYQCGEEPEIDNEKSNKNWKVYKNSKECKCGGKLRLKTIL